MIEQLIQWLEFNYLEVIAATIGLISIYLQIKQHILYWPVTIVLVSLYIVVYIDAKLYADMSLQVYYLVISFYGWHHWMYGNNKDKTKKLEVSQTHTKQAILYFLISIILFLAISQILVYFTDSDLPYWDAFTTALSFIATWMLAKKILENWLLWIVVDAVSVGIYIYKDLYATSILFIVLTILAFVGYYSWRKSMRENNDD